MKLIRPETKFRAQKNADHILTLLEPGWTTRVWENLGWHSSVVSPCGRWKVHPSFYGELVYTAFLGKAGSGGGYWTGKSNDPKKAIEICRKNAFEDLEWQADLLDMVLVKEKT